jgi:hypothetical protein
MQMLAKKPGDEPVNLVEQEPADYEGRVATIKTPVFLSEGNRPGRPFMVDSTILSTADAANRPRAVLRAGVPQYGTSPRRYTVPRPSHGLPH